MRRTILVALCLAACSPAVAGQQAPRDDEFSLLDLPRPSSMRFSFGMPMNIGKLIDSIDVNKMDASGPAAAPEASMGRTTLFHLPPALSGMFRRFGGHPALETEMRMGPVAIPMNLFSLSNPMQKLQSVGANCLPCGQVKSHMRSISIMHGPEGQRVETVTEVCALTCCCNTFLPSFCSAA
jgi:hypothetical protein